MPGGRVSGPATGRKDSESREPCKRSLLGFAWPRRILSSMQSKIAKVESHAKGACSVLHGRDASCLRRQPKIAKGESNGNKLVWLPLPNRILSSMQSKIAKVEHRANGLARVCIVQSRPARTILQKGFEEILRWGGDARFFSKSFALSYYQNL